MGNREALSGRSVHEQSYRRGTDRQPLHDQASSQARAATSGGRGPAGLSPAGKTHGGDRSSLCRLQIRGLRADRSRQPDNQHGAGPHRNHPDIRADAAIRIENQGTPRTAFAIGQQGENHRGRRPVPFRRRALARSGCGCRRSFRIRRSQAGGGMAEALAQQEKGDRA